MPRYAKTTLINSNLPPQSQCKHATCRRDQSPNTIEMGSNVDEALSVHRVNFDAQKGQARTGLIVRVFARA